MGASSHTVEFLAVWGPAGEIAALPDARKFNRFSSMRGTAGHPAGDKDWDFQWVIHRALPSAAISDVRVVQNERGVALFRGLLYRERSPEPCMFDLLRDAARGDYSVRLNNLSGTFCGVLYDSTHGCVILFTDGYAVERLFYARYKSGWAIATDPFRLAATIGNWQISPDGAGAILFCGYSLALPLFRGQSIVHAGCAVALSRTTAEEKPYWQDVEGPLGRRRARKNLEEGHASFWTAPVIRSSEQFSLLLSGGRDSRILLKFALAAGYRPHLITYERRGNPVYPFITFLLEDTKDRAIAEALAKDLKMGIEVVRIPNQHLLQCLNDIVWLNHGSPLHWELHYLGKHLGVNSEPLVVGFEGDVIASLHSWKSGPAEEFARRWLGREGAPPVYESARHIFEISAANFGRLVEQISGVFQMSASSPPSVRGRWAVIRVRGAGRNVPTFHQVRPFRTPVYPYLDRELRRAYELLPDQDLAYRRAHTRLLLDDRRFSRLPVSRIGLNVNFEVRWGPWIRRAALLGKVGASFVGRGWWGLTAEVRQAIERTWADLGGDMRKWRRWIDACGAKEGFADQAARLLEWRRIERSVAEWRSSYMTDVEGVPT